MRDGKGNVLGKIPELVDRLTKKDEQGDNKQFKNSRRKNRRYIIKPLRLQAY